MIGWWVLLLYELLTVPWARYDRANGRKIPKWREPMTYPAHREMLKRPLVWWAFGGMVAYHFLQPLFEQKSEY